VLPRTLVHCTRNACSSSRRHGASGSAAFPAPAPGALAEVDGGDDGAEVAGVNADTDAAPNGAAGGEADVDTDNALPAADVTAGAARELALASDEAAFLAMRATPGTSGEHMVWDVGGDGLVHSVTLVDSAPIDGVDKQPSDTPFSSLSVYPY
jgi:hypothetical protein